MAQARPDAFNPDLAASLNNLGDRLEAVGRLNEALASDREAIACLAASFLRLLAAFAPPMTMKIADYRRRAAAVGEAVDETLLQPVEAVLSRHGKSRVGR